VHHDPPLERRQPEPRDQELTGDDRGDHPAGEDARVDQDDQHGQHQELVGDRAIS
jgi:hypothetical protein